MDFWCQDVVCDWQVADQTVLIRFGRKLSNIQIKRNHRNQRPLVGVGPGSKQWLLSVSPMTKPKADGAVLPMPSTIADNMEEIAKALRRHQPGNQS